MKKKQFLLLCALLTMIGVQNVKADPVGVAVQTGTYYLYNVGAKKYMTVGQVWGSRANVSESEALPAVLSTGSADGTFKIISKLSGNTNGLFIDGTPAPYLDNGSPVDLTFEKQGDENIYKIKGVSTENGSPTRYIKWDGTNDALIAGDAEASGDNDKWIITTEDNMKADLYARMASATPENPVNVTLLVKSARPAWGTSAFWPYTNWTNGNSENATDRHGGGSAAVMGYWGSTDKDIYQNLTNLRKGTYKVRCLGFARAGDWASNYCWEHKNDQNSAVYITSGDNTETGKLPSIFEGAQTSPLGAEDKQSKYNLDGGTDKYIPNAPSAAAIYFAQHVYTTWAEATLTVQNSEARIGVRNTSSQWEWVEVSQFELLYLEPYIEVAAASLPANGAMAADTWYKYEVQVTGNYIISATTPANIQQTTNGEQLVGTGTGSALVTGDEVALTAGDVIYYKSSSNNTLTIEANIKTYTVGDVTATSIADNTYLQELTTVTFTLGDATTNDGTATLELQGTPTAALNDGSSDVAEGALTLNATTKVVTATFTSVTLNPATTYTITLPADAVAWDKNTTNKNSAKVITFKTPAVFDGYFFIKQNDADKYVSRGGNDNTEAILDSYGIPVQITTDADNVSLVKFMDNNRYLYAGSTSVYSDKELAAGGNNVKWTIASYSGGYSFYNSARGKYMAAGVGAEAPNVPAAVRADAAYAWTLEATSAHPAKMQAVKDAQADAAATAAGISASTQADLKTYLSEHYGETPVAITGVPSVVDQYQKKADKGNGKKKTFMTETKNGLSHGLYRLRVNAFERIAGLDAVLSAGGAPGLAYVYANDQKIQLCSLAETYKAGSAWSSGSPADVSKPEGYYVNNTTSADVAFDEGHYVNDVYVYLDTDDSSIEFGIETTNSYGATDNSQWICYNNFSLVKFDVKPTDDEKSALASAISTAEGKTLGFEAGEYAPYSNVDALTKLAAAKAINTEVASREVVVAATTALTGATWTANVGKVDAICNGSFTGIERGTQDNVVPGWTGVFRKLITTEDYDALSASDEGSAMFSHAKTYVYGDQVGYTLPFKSNAKYTLSFKAAGWENGNFPTVSAVVKKPNGDNLKTLSISPTKRISEAESLVSGSVDFVVETAGNYTIEVTVPDNTLAVITDFSIASSGVVVTLGANGYATFACPYALDLTKTNLPTGLKAYKAQSVNSTYVHFEEFDQTVPANTGILFKGTASETYNIPVVASGDAVSGNLFLVNEGNGYIDPSYDEGTTEVYYFAMIKDSDPLTFGKFNPASYKYPSNKAYLTVAKNTGARLAVSFGEEDGFTGINAIESTEAENGALKDGKYLIDGKIVLVKNGVKYDANGKKLN